MEELTCCLCRYQRDFMPCSGCMQQTEHCWRMKMSGALAPCWDKQPYNDSFANPAITLHKGNWFGNERE